MPFDVPNRPDPYITIIDWKADFNDKMILPPQLEDCREGLAACRGSDKLPFNIERAKRNLKRGDQQLVNLRAMKLQLQPELQPVLEYFCLKFEFFLNLEKARLDYVASSDAKGIKSILCATCACSEGEPALDLEMPRVLEERENFSRFTIAETVRKCYQKHVANYPLAAWNTFKKDFGITDSHSFHFAIDN